MVKVLKKSPRKVTLVPASDRKIRMIVKQRENGVVTTIESPKNGRGLKDQIIMSDMDLSRNSNIVGARSEAV